MLTSVGKLWTRSQKLAYTLLNKLSTRNEPLLMPGDRVSHEMKLCSLVVSCMLHSLLHFRHLAEAPKLVEEAQCPQSPVLVWSHSTKTIFF